MTLPQFLRGNDVYRGVVSLFHRRAELFLQSFHPATSSRLAVVEEDWDLIFRDVLPGVVTATANSPSSDWFVVAYTEVSVEDEGQSSFQRLRVYAVVSSPSDTAKFIWTDISLPGNTPVNSLGIAGTSNHIHQGCSENSTKLATARVHFARVGDFRTFRTVGLSLSCPSPAIGLEVELQWEFTGVGPLAESKGLC